MIGAKLSGDLGAFAFFVFLSHRYGEAGLGLYSFAIAIGSSVAALADFGLYDFTIRELNNPARDRRRFLALVAILRILLSLAAFIVLVALSTALADGEGRFAVLMVVGAQQILVAFANGCAAVLAARDDMAFPAVIEGLARLCGVGIGIGLALQDLPLALVLIGPILAALFQIGVVLSRVRKHEVPTPQGGPPAFGAKLGDLVRTATSALPYLLSDLARRIAIRSDLIMLGLLVTLSLTGLYAAAQRIVALLLFLPHFAALALLPSLSRLAHRDQVALRELGTNACRIGILVGLPGAVGLVLIAPDLCRRLYGNEFEAASALLALLAPLFLCECVRSPLANFLTATGQQDFRTRAEWEALAMALPSQWVGITLAGPAGAAIAIVASELFLMVRMLLRLRSELDIEIVARALMPAALGCALMALPALVWPLSIWLILPSAIPIYALSILLFSEVRQRELNTLQEIYAKRPLQKTATGIDEDG